MKCLMVMPRIVSKVGDAYQFPLGLPYVSAALKKAGVEVITLNLNQKEGTVKELLIKYIEQNDIKIIMTGGLSFQYWPLYQILETVKNYNKELLTVVGGGIITSDPPAAMEALHYADIGVVGEGEITVVELMKGINEKCAIEKINGLILAGNFADGKFTHFMPNEFKMTVPREAIENLDELAWPDFDGFDFAETMDYSAGISGLNSTRTIYMLASRSCPYLCSFCFHTVGRKYRQRSLDSFFAELEHYVEHYKINFVCIADELLSYNNERIKEFCERIKKYNIGWWAQFRVDSLEPWLIPLLKDSGCQVMSFGLESADNRVLKSMGKHITIEQTDATLKKVQEAGMPFEGAFIFGDTAETYETAQNTLDYWLKHPEYRINLNTITVFPGCPLYQHAKKNGIIKNAAQYLIDGCPQINLTHMTDEEFADIVGKILRYPHLKARKLENEEITAVDYEKARVDIKSNCTVCGKKNVWEKIKLFTANGLACEECGQRYNVFMPEKFKDTFDNNIKKCLKTGKVAVWGMNYVSTKIFEESELLKEHKDIFPVDSSKIKQVMKIGAHKVNAPNIIEQENISTVIIAIPAFYHEISLQIHYLYPNVKNVVDITDLIREDFSIK